MNKIDFIGFIECRNANPNGDIDMENRPHQDDNGFGYMTDVCIKRKIKDCATLLADSSERYNLYIVNDGIPLERKSNEFTDANGGYEKIAEMSPEERHALVKDGFKARYFDIRAFGGVITSFTKDKYLDGQIRGAVQISFAQSLEEVFPEQITISRVSIQTEKDAKEKKTELGKKWIVPYGVYMFEGHISPFLAEKNGFDEKDKEILIKSILGMYEHCLSASSVGMSVLKLFVFEHGSKLGDCSFKKIKDSVAISRTDDSDFVKCPYEISLNKAILPESLKIECYE